MKDKEIDKLDLSGWPVHDDYLVELGRVAALWSSLESFLDLCLGKLAGFDNLLGPKPFIFVNHMSLPQKLDVLGTLCEILLPEHQHLQAYKTVIGQLRSAQKARNTFLHNGLARNEESGQIEMGEGSARGTLKTKVTPVSLTDIRRASIEIHLAQLALYKLVLRRELAPAWERRKPT